MDFYDMVCSEIIKHKKKAWNHVLKENCINTNDQFATSNSIAEPDRILGSNEVFGLWQTYTEMDHTKTTRSFSINVYNASA